MGEDDVIAVSAWRVIFSCPREKAVLMAAGK